MKFQEIPRKVQIFRDFSLFVKKKEMVFVATNVARLFSSLPANVAGEIEKIRPLS
jgi:hypothetical protein